MLAYAEAHKELASDHDTSLICKGGLPLYRISGGNKVCSSLALENSEHAQYVNEGWSTHGTVSSQRPPDRGFMPVVVFVDAFHPMQALEQHIQGVLAEGNTHHDAA